MHVCHQNGDFQIGCDWLIFGCHSKEAVALCVLVESRFPQPSGFPQPCKGFAAKVTGNPYLPSTKGHSEFTMTSEN